RTETLQYGNCANLLQHEHPRDARDGDAAENDNDEADKAQVVLRPIEIAANRIVGRSIGTRVDVVVAEVLVERGHHVVERVVRPARQNDAACTAAKYQQLCRRHVVEVDEYTWSQGERAEVSTGLVRNDAADDEVGRADRDGI